MKKILFITVGFCLIGTLTIGVLFLMATPNERVDMPDYTEQLTEISENIKTIEILEVEVPVPIVVQKIETIEVPTVVYEVVEIPTIVYETEISKTLFATADTDLLIMVVSKGEVSYTIEFAYKDTLLNPPMLYIIQIEKQVNGETEDWFFISDYSDDQSVFEFEVEDWYDFVYEVKLFFEESNEVLWEVMVLMYQEFYNDYYNIGGN